MTNHLSAQSEIFNISRDRVVLVRIGCSTITDRLVSSANKRMSDSMSDTISLMNMRNNKGPRIEPWGTPACMVAQSEEVPGSITR